MSGFQRPHCQNAAACAAKSPTTHCRSCIGKAQWADPERAERARAAIKARYDRPGQREKRAADCRAASVRNWADPEKRARMTEASRRNNHVQGAKCQALAQTPEAKAKRVRGFVRTKNAWCPEDRYPDYRHLIDVKGVEPSEARRMIEADIKAAARRTIDRITADMHAKAERQKRDAY